MNRWIGKEKDWRGVLSWIRIQSMLIFIQFSSFFMKITLALRMDGPMDNASYRGVEASKNLLYFVNLAARLIRLNRTGCKDENDEKKCKFICWDDNNEKDANSYVFPAPQVSELQLAFVCRRNKGSSLGWRPGNKMPDDGVGENTRGKNHHESAVETPDDEPGKNVWWKTIMKEPLRRQMMNLAKMYEEKLSWECRWDARWWTWQKCMMKNHHESGVETPEDEPGQNCFCRLCLS